MTDAPKRIWAWPHFDGWITGDWSANTYHDDRTVEYIRADEHDRIVAEKDAEIAAARDKALEDAAMCCEAEADKCDDAVKWNGPGRYARDCKAAAYAMRDRAAAIRAMKG